jgi:hypothetical protein
MAPSRSLTASMMTSPILIFCTADSVMMHNDLPAVAGPGGGAVLTLVEPVLPN